jgi:tetratricopeptide (TPR) repeat protein
VYYRYLFFVIIALGLLAVCQSCNDNWLDAKPDKSLGVPNTIKDYQALLDNSSQTFNVSQSSGLAEISSGDFYISFASWNSLFSKAEKSGYVWAPTENFYGGEPSTDWRNGYKRILNANIILEGIEKIKPVEADRQAWTNVKGSALFFRAFDFFNLSQEYCKPYLQASAQTDLGLPLRLENNVNLQVRRSSLQDTYDRILKDLKSAAQLLGVTPGYKTRPSKQAVFALLARTYLSMENYDQAGLYADSALQIQSELTDYETLNATAAYPVSQFNEEVIFHSTFSYGIFNASRLIVEPSLLATYAASDCRRTVFFKSIANGGVTFKGNYSGDKNLFGGLATDELYLIRAECKARKGEVNAALADLNRLLRKRWKGNYEDIVIKDQNAALSVILAERRKELVFRGLRWGDLRRLNRDGRFAVTITRTLNNQVYKLLPEDKRYVLPIDEQEIRLGGIEQNERE